MNHAKVENGQVTQVDLPTTGTLKDGRTVSSYNLLDYITLKNEGWLFYIDSQPEYNPETQYLEPIAPTITTTEVTANYIVKTIPIIIPVPTTEERLAAVEEYLMSL